MHATLRVAGSNQFATLDREESRSVLADVSKAFDTICHQKLLIKLQNLHFNHNALCWFSSYFENIKQFVQNNSMSSQILPVVTGVPQGSILGPILFNIYISLMTDGIELETIQYADDTQIFLSGKSRDASEIADECSLALDKLFHWANDNRLAFNSSKTVFLSICTPQLKSKIQLDDLSVTVNGTQINRCDVQKNLGVYFDSTLSFSEHHNKTLRSCYGVLSNLRKMRNFIPSSFRKILIEALVFSKLRYCNIVTYPLNSATQKRYTRIEKACASFVTGKYCHTDDVKKVFGWQNHNQYTEFSILCQIYRLMNFEESPSYLSLELVANSSYDLRRNNSTLLHPGVPGTFQHQASVLFNTLPNEIKNISGRQNFKRFKSTIKKHLTSV